MKNLLFILITCATIWSCSNPTDHNSNSEDTTAINNQTILIDTSKIKTSDNSNLADTLSAINNTILIDPTKTEINTAFPFGCIDLTKYKYPKHWKGHEEGLEQPQGKEFEDIGVCFQKINSGKSIGSLKTNKLEVLQIGNRYKDYYYDTLTARSTENCRYRLPDIGSYECFYFYNESNAPRGGYGVYGNLLLFDPTTQNGKLINIFYEYGGDQNIKNRYFMAYKDSINIYEGSCYDDGCSLTQTYRINISQTGEIDIIKTGK